jgi:hypothetical protein
LPQIARAAGAATGCIEALAEPGEGDLIPFRLPAQTGTSPLSDLFGELTARERSRAVITASLSFGDHTCFFTARN